MVDSIHGLETSPDGRGEDGLLRPGDRIGSKFVVEELIGTGGTAAVYRAVHVAVGHRVAVKVVHLDHHPASEVLARFRREARICGAIRSPHVPQVHDVGRLEDGSPYIVMEYLHGETLEERLHRGPLPAATAVQITLEILSALDAVHRHGAVHRDVKPENVILHEDETGARMVKLVDFGISKQPEDLDAQVTVTGLVIGTPHYMAPEQVRGEPVDLRVDLYATGVVLYEALTGRTAFQGNNPAEVTRSVLRDPVIPVRVLADGCPKALETLVERAMERDRARRFPSAEVMSAALRRIAAQNDIVLGEAAWAIDSDGEPIQLRRRVDESGHHVAIQRKSDAVGRRRRRTTRTQPVVFRSSRAADEPIRLPKRHYRLQLAAVAAAFVAGLGWFGWELYGGQNPFVSSPIQPGDIEESLPPPPLPQVELDDVIVAPALVTGTVKTEATTIAPAPAPAATPDAVAPAEPSRARGERDRDADERRRERRRERERSETPLPPAPASTADPARGAAPSAGPLGAVISGELRTAVLASIDDLAGSASIAPQAAAVADASAVAGDVPVGPSADVPAPALPDNPFD